MRIVSLLPAATEILYAIGAGEDVVGVTHECDFPTEAARKPVLIRPRVDPAAPQGEIDALVREIVRRGESLYAVDAELLASLEPDLIVTQDLCHVCAASPEDLAAVLAKLPPQRRPRIETFSPHLLADVWNGIRNIGAAAQRATQADALAAQLEREVARIASQSADYAQRPRVVCLEWFDPPYFAGHWVPEMVRLAGGQDVFGEEGKRSQTVPWHEIVRAQPEIIILMSCGYNSHRNMEMWESAKVPPNWQDVPAVKSGRIYAVDANAYFSRSGPRLAEGTALLAGLFHPQDAPAQLGSSLLGARAIAYGSKD